MNSKTPIALTIAGSDSGGGAGIQADLKTFSALGVYGASVLTALTAQNTQGVTAIHDVPAPFITAQIDAVFSDIAVDAVKIGMLSQVEAISAVAEGITKHQPSWVILDPVMVATSGDALLAPEAETSIISKLFPLASLITPNAFEAAKLVGATPAATRGEMLEQANGLLSFGAQAVLLKGGHSADTVESTDLLLSGDAEPIWLSSARVATQNTHGTGCTLSSAIAASLAKGATLAEACRAAKAYVSEAIKAADTLSIGRGSGPVHHFHAHWS